MRERSITRLLFLIGQMQRHVVEMDEDTEVLAARLRCFGNTRWESQAAKLIQIKAQLNLLGNLTQNMTGLPPWQKRRIDAFSAVTKAMGEKTDAAIRLVHEHQNTSTLHLDKEYRAQISALQKLADEMRTLRNFPETGTQDRQPAFETVF